MLIIPPTLTKGLLFFINERKFQVPNAFDLKNNKEMLVAMQIESEISENC